MDLCIISKNFLLIRREYFPAKFNIIYEHKSKRVQRMDNRQKAPAKEHKIIMDSRKSVVITGVTDTDKFTENTVLLYTCMGEVIIRGRDLRVTLLSVETGDMSVEGEIDGIIYGDSQVKSPLSFMGKLFK